MPRFPQLQGQDGNTRHLYGVWSQLKNGLLEALRATLPKEGTKLKITVLILSAFYLLLL